MQLGVEAGAMMIERPNIRVNQFPKMVRWYDPLVLLKTAWGAILSVWFGRYADQRLMQQALDRVDTDKLTKRYDLTGKITPNPEGAFWVDFVADIGDGFDSTYAVAHMLAQPTLTPNGGSALPQGSLLILGGDLVYPYPSRERYIARMREPYGLAYPNDESTGEDDKPLIFAIPGNHDWYDGLAGYCHTFCRARDEPPLRDPRKIGNWRCPQHRSYFALQLPFNWWIWGVDIALSGWVDEPQVAYFRLIAENLDKDAKIIICTAKPSWQHEFAYGEDEVRTLTYVANLAWEAKNRPTIKAILAGDLHHYSRYESADGCTQLFTSGGGGAFLLSTHHLGETVQVEWKDDVIPFALGRSGSSEACYPPRDICRSLLWHNLWFPVTNYQFTLTLGVIAWLTTFFFADENDRSLFDRWIADPGFQSGNLIEWIYMVLSNVLASPLILMLVLAVFACLVFYAGRQRHWMYGAVGLVHAAVQIALFFFLAITLRYFNTAVLQLDADCVLTKILYLAELILICGLISGTVWGIYLTLTSQFLNLHVDHAFSAMRIANYRNFLRLRITEDELKVYPIGLDIVPRRKEWEQNPNAKEGSPQSVLQPSTPLRPILIEPPIVVRSNLKQDLARQSMRPRG